MSLIDYPITRPVHLGVWGNISLIFHGLVWVAFVTVISVAAVAYELVPIISTQFNESYVLWYERLIPSTSLLPQARNCTGSIIQLMEGLRSWSDANLSSYNEYHFLL